MGASMAKRDTGPDADIALALATLRAVCRLDDAQPSARSGAARTLLEFYGSIGAGRTKAPPDAARADAELSRAELVERAKTLRANGARTLT
jgi:hypothetical protein